MESTKEIIRDLSFPSGLVEEHMKILKAEKSIIKAEHLRTDNDRHSYRLTFKKASDKDINKKMDDIINKLYGTN